MTHSPAPTQAPIRLLIVDDDPETARLLRSWFDGQPYEILEALNAEQGLQIARRHAPDLVLLDIRMPGMDGLAAARHLKQDPITRSTPLILLTACREVQAKVEAFSAGADDYITKPFAFEEVDARVRAMLRKRELYLKLEHAVRDLRSSNAKLEELLVIDEKTGLSNFRQFRRKLEEEWLRSERYGAPLSLVMLDLDHFKLVNDTLGHLAGDAVLREFAMLVVGGARATDIAARYGGEEFAIILPHTGGERAVRVAERIRAATAQFVFLDEDQPQRLTVSAGTATYPSHPEIDSADSLIEAADDALYEAKRRGRDRVVSYRAEPSPSAEPDSQVGVPGSGQEPTASAERRTRRKQPAP